MAQKSESESQEGRMRFYKEAGLYFGGLFLMFIGILVSLTIVGVIIGGPLVVVGYAVYKSSSIAKETPEGIKVDYREKDE
ncbi:MAG: DUF5362 family protein [Halobacteria archaeon]|nr:DUF5362 family protein [Halobacteria archaeon]